MKNSLKNPASADPPPINKNEEVVSLDEPVLSLKEQLDRAHVTISGPTYEVLTGKISEEEYRRQINK